MLGRPWAKINTEMRKKKTASDKSNSSTINTYVPCHIFNFYFHKPSFQSSFVVSTSLEVTAGCLRSECAGRHTNVHTELVGRLGLLPAAQRVSRESRSQRRAVSGKTLSSGCSVCAFFLFSTTLDRSATLFPCRGKREKRGEREGGFTSSFFSIQPHVSAVIAF